MYWCIQKPLAVRMMPPLMGYQKILKMFLKVTVLWTQKTFLAVLCVLDNGLLYYVIWPAFAKWQRRTEHQLKIHYMRRGTPANKLASYRLRDVAPLSVAHKGAWNYLSLFNVTNFIGYQEFIYIYIYHNNSSAINCHANFSVIDCHANSSITDCHANSAVMRKIFQPIQC